MNSSFVRMTGTRFKEQKEKKVVKDLLKLCSWCGRKSQSHVWIIDNFLKRQGNSCLFYLCLYWIFCENYSCRWINFSRLWESTRFLVLFESNNGRSCHNSIAFSSKESCIPENILEKGYILSSITEFWWTNIRNVSLCNLVAIFPCRSFIEKLLSCSIDEFLFLVMEKCVLAMCYCESCSCFWSVVSSPIIILGSDYTMI